MGFLAASGWWIAIGVFLAFHLEALAQSPGRSSPVLYNRDIRPILSDNCFACHGPDKNARKSNLRLDQREGALAARDGKAAVLPGKPLESELFKRITTHDADDVMPPRKTGKRITESQTGLLKRWIEEGAHYEGHWSFTPPRRVALPRTPASHPVDSFVRDRLSAAQLQPSSPAPARMLVRRLSLDLVGLPPETSDVDAFARKPNAESYLKLVEKYLASPHFGERMAVHWLDLARYADTVGFHGDMPISVWPYRDYVIESFNRNLPFDQFTREQIGGDLMPSPSTRQRAASTYNRLNRMSTEGGIQDKEYRAKYLADRVRTTSTAWLGVTLACAECHDHKFDPFTIRDFYNFGAFFADLNEKGFYDRGYSANDWGPRARLLNSAQEARLKQLDAGLEQVNKELSSPGDDSLADARARWETWILEQEKSGGLAWSPLTPRKATSSAGTRLEIQSDKSVVPSTTGPALDDYMVALHPDGRRVRSVMVEIIPDGSFAGNGIARSGDSFYIAEIELIARENIQGLATRLKVVDVKSDLDVEGYPAGNVIDGDASTVWGQGAIAGGHRRVILMLGDEILLTTNHVLEVHLRHSTRHAYQQTGRFRVQTSPLSEPDYHSAGVPDNLLAALKAEAGKRTDEQKKLLASQFRLLGPDLAKARAEKRRLQTERSRLLGMAPATLVSEAMPEPRMIRVLARGDWMDEKGDIAKPATPAFLSGNGTTQTTLNRLHLADWIVSRDNPLTARAFVNRLWKQFFGAGLSRTVEDLGLQGEWPSHPELLDWLAVEFMESGWNVKHMVRLLVTSETYQQSSVRNGTADDTDPVNRWLSRQSPIRLEAEFIRDNALAISGLLSREIGGESVQPYQPAGYYAPLNFPRREYAEDIGARQHRRGLYTHWQRSFVHPSMVAFDAPSREECTASRPVSNTPLQALVLLNDPTYLEAARAFAQMAMAEGGGTDARKLDWMFQRALARPPTREESRLLLSLLKEERDRFSKSPDETKGLLTAGIHPLPEKHVPSTLAAWTSAARAILNLHETITRH